MGKLIYNLNVSLDRFIETPDHSLDWSAARSVQLDHPDEPGPRRLTSNGTGSGSATVDGPRGSGTMPAT